MSNKYYNVDDCAEALECQFYQVIHRERVGKYPPARRNKLNDRIYTEQDIRELKLIEQGKAKWDKVKQQVIPISSGS